MSAKAMKSKQGNSALSRNAPDLHCEGCVRRGMTINCITKNAIDRAARKIVRGVRSGERFLSPGDTGKSRPEPRATAPNGIFQECRNSPAMKRYWLFTGGRAGMKFIKLPVGER